MRLQIALRVTTQTAPLATLRLRGILSPRRLRHRKHRRIMVTTSLTRRQLRRLLQTLGILLLQQPK